MVGTLYVVATPIGNREDISARALKILREVDCIAAEDTRTTQNLLKMYNISKKTVSNHKFNEQRSKSALISLLLDGKSVAVVSDAGTPCISDPGSILISAAIDNAIPVIGICGANAAITALSVSGFYCSTFSFYGFLPRKEREIEGTFLKALTSGVRVCVFYESPKRIIKSIQILQQVTPDSKVCLCNDLTKKYERTYHGAPAQVIEELIGNPDSGKGEYTLVIEFPKVSTEQEITNSGETNEGRLINYMVLNNVSAKEAISALSGNGITKKELYAAALHLKKLFSSDK